MLTQEENNLLCRVGPGTPMGDFMRQYWLPLVTTQELSDPDGPPKRVRLLGENLIAFRDTGGRVGLLANNCPHRGASMFFGRNEEDGLRCVYHGWKFNAAGACVDMPNEPPESNFKHKIQIAAYPCRELSGIIWTYMGPRAVPPPFPPEYGWALAPESHKNIIKYQPQCNWLQSLEGDIDSAHVNYLHSLLAFAPHLGKIAERAQANLPPGRGPSLNSYDNVPHMEVVDTDVGVMYAARRATVDTGKYYYRVAQLIFPFVTNIAGSGEDGDPGMVKVWVPMDDGHTMVWELHWSLTDPITEAERARLRASRIPPSGYLANTTDWVGDWRFAANMTNDFMIDRERQRTWNYTGFADSAPLQDRGIQETMGPILDRTKEHLGTADAQIIQVRRRYMRAARELREGVTPPGVDNPALFRKRGVALLLPKGVSWVEANREPMQEVVGAWTR